MNVYNVVLKCSILDRKHTVSVEAENPKEAAEIARNGSLAYFVVSVTLSEDEKASTAGV